MEQTSINKIFNEAMGYWRAVMKYNVYFSLLYFSLFMIMIFGIINYLEVMPMFLELGKITDVKIYTDRLNAILKTEQMASFPMLVIICSGLIYPLHIGFFKIFKKIDNKEEIFLSDLFEGYQGSNFLKFTMYYIFWVMIYNYTKAITMAFFLLAIVPLFWVSTTLFISPLMYFKKEPLGTALLWNFQVLRKNFRVLMLCVLATTIISYSGLLMMLVGYALTFPFWNAMIYTLYKYIFEQEKNNL